ITDINQFIQYMYIVDKYLLDTSYIFTDPLMNIWIGFIRDRQRGIWHSNAALLEPTDKKRFMKAKFQGAPAQVPPGYPAALTSTKAVKHMKLGPINPPHLLSKEDLAELFSILVRSDGLSYVYKLMIVLGSSIEYTDLIFCNPHVMEIVGSHLALFPVVIFYSMRILYLEETSKFTNSQHGDRHILSSASMLAFPTVVAPLQPSHPYCPAILTINS